MTRDKQLAEFLARKGVTKCPPAESFADQAVPLSRARRDNEKVLTEPAELDDRDHEVIERERGAERRYLEIQGVHD
jgi:hypothetical protein